MLANFASFILIKTSMAALVLLQSGSGAQRFDLWQMWLHMQWPARSIAIILLGMSLQVVPWREGLNVLNGRSAAAGGGVNPASETTLRGHRADQKG